MSQIEELQIRICNLPTEDFAKLREWFLQLEELRQILREENYELEIPPRVNHPNAFIERLEEDRLEP